MFRRRHKPIHYRQRPRLVGWFASIVIAGLAIGAMLHWWVEPFGIASSPRQATRAATYSGRAEASGPTALRIEPVSLVLYGVDPPGAGIECAAGDCATLARAAMARLLGERDVHCVGRPQPDGRPAATCFLPDGTDVASALVARGWALAAAEAPLYRAEEERARGAGIGLWARPAEPLAPGNASAELPSMPESPLPPPVGEGGFVPPEE